jgi:hypothetical protein
MNEIKRRIIMWAFNELPPDIAGLLTELASRRQIELISGSGGTFLCADQPELVRWCFRVRDPEDCERYIVDVLNQDLWKALFMGAMEMWAHGMLDD